MTDQDFELHLRANLRDIAEPASSTLRASIVEIPDEVEASRGFRGSGWTPTQLRFAGVAAASMTLAAIILAGFGLLLRPPNVGPPAASVAPPAPSASTSGPVASAAATEPVRGWPGPTRSGPGLYSWNGPRGHCARVSCNVGFMHNGYGSGDVEITVRGHRAGVLSGAEGTPTTVAGHAGIYQLIDAGTAVSPRVERWLVDVEDTTITIELTARSGTSDADLAEAHAIIDSMRTEPQETDLGFRLIFRLETDDWDSG